VMKEKTEVGGHGSFTIVSDPAGGMIGLWETKKK
jgi:predicted enzyme related to lactoylglutathione lyase